MITPGRDGSIASSRRGNRSERGVVLIFVAVTLLMLAAFMALAIDVGFMYTAKADLQTTIDAAALAGASALTLGPDEARARAMEYAGKNPVFLNSVVLSAADIEIGEWNPATRQFVAFEPDDEVLGSSVRVTGHLTEARGNPLTLLFARVVGADSADVRAQSVAVAGSEVAWDVVILQDVTGSFEQEIDTAVEADRGLLGCIADHAGENSRVGFAIHTGWGQAITPLWSIADGYADLAIILDGVDSCGNPGMPPCSGTDHAAGLESALSVFENSPANPYPNAKKAIVMVTDGRPNVEANGAHAGLTDAQLAQVSLQWADMAWEDEIHIFGVFYDDEDDDFAAEFLESMTRGEGTFQRTPDPDDLGLLLSEVCSALIPELRLVE